MSFLFSRHAKIMQRTLSAIGLAIALVVAPLASANADTQPDNIFPRVKFVTSHGNMVVELNRMRAPITVENFLEYVVDGSYNNTLFHRVINDFVVQGGGFDTDWESLPTRDPIVNESGNGLSNRFGTIAMARESAPHSATRQFYFNAKDNDSLNPSARRWGYTVFGEVIENAELLQEMMAVETAIHELTGYSDVPVEPMLLIRVELLPEDY